MPISIITPTQGRATLARALESAGPLAAGDEWLVMVDAYELPEAELERVASLAAEYGARAIPVDAGRHTWGHDQLNEGLAIAAPGNYIVFMDDDDIFAPGALDGVRAAMADDAERGEPRLHIRQFVTPWRATLPNWPDVRECRIGGHCIITPNIPGMVARFGPHYNGDYTYIAEALNLWGGVNSERVHFRPELIAITRPD